MKISELLRLIQQSHTHIAVVVDEFGGTKGILTLEDILEQLVGNIWDEHDVVEHDIKELNETTYIVSSSCSLDDFFEAFSFSEDADDYDSVTVGGWVMEKLGEVPEVGSHFVFHDSEVYVVSMEKRHVKEIRIHLSKPLSSKNQAEA